MMDQDMADLGWLRRLDCVASSYSELGGLRLVPVGIFALSMVPLAVLVQLSAYWGSMAVVGSLEIAVAAFWLISLWYRENYGMTLEAWPQSKWQARRWALAWGGAAAMVVAAVSDLGAFAELVGYLAGAAVLVWMLVYWCRVGRMWPQGFALAALLVVGGLLHHAVAAGPSMLGHEYAVWILAFIGVILLIVGVIDHSRLAETKKPLEDCDDG